jgi:hypothetical protein
MDFLWNWLFGFPGWILAAGALIAIWNWPWHF